MVNRKRQAALRAGIILLVVMLFFTFFAGSINYFLTPKVTVTVARQGVLTRSLSFGDPELYYEGGVDAELPAVVSMPLTAVEIRTGKDNEVRAGEIVVVFDIAPLEEALETASFELEDAKEALWRFNAGFEEERLRLERQLEDDALNIAAMRDGLRILTGNARAAMLRQIERLEQDSARREETLAHMLESKVYAGQSLRAVEGRVEAAAERRDALNEAITACREVRAGADGYISEIYAEEGQKYTGGETLFTIVTDGAEAYIRQRMSREEAAPLAEGSFAAVEYTEQTDMFAPQVRTTGAQVESITASGDQFRPYLVIAKFTQGIPYGAQIGRVRFDLPGVSGIIVPAGALVDGGSVYVVTKRDSFLGEELLAEKRYVNVGEISAGQAVIEDGLEGGEYVVTSWDRPVTDGKRVLLPYD